jgi:predicted metal-binding protein
MGKNQIVTRQEEKQMTANDQELIRLAAQAGFSDAAVIDTAKVPFEPAFRACCEDNTCGKYGVNYACPPDCGTTDEMAQRVKARKKALVLQSIWQIDDPMDPAQTKPAKAAHNKMTRELIDRLEASGVGTGFMIGASGCALCSPCAVVEKQPCRFPNLRFSCVSAYCIYVQKLCELCGMEYDCGTGLVALFGIYVFDPAE